MLITYSISILISHYFLILNNNNYADDKSILHNVNQQITCFLSHPGDDKETLLRKKIWLIIVACFLF